MKENSDNRRPRDARQKVLLSERLAAKLSMCLRRLGGATVTRGGAEPSTRLRAARRSDTRIYTTAPSGYRSPGLGRLRQYSITQPRLDTCRQLGCAQARVLPWTEPALGQRASSPKARASPSRTSPTRTSSSATLLTAWRRALCPSIEDQGRHSRRLTRSHSSEPLRVCATDPPAPRTANNCQML